MKFNFSVCIDHFESWELDRASEIISPCCGDLLTYYHYASLETVIVHITSRPVHAADLSSSVMCEAIEVNITYKYAKRFTFRVINSGEHWVPFRADWHGEAKWGNSSAITPRVVETQNSPPTPYNPQCGIAVAQGLNACQKKDGPCRYSDDVVGW